MVPYENDKTAHKAVASMSAVSPSLFLPDMLFVLFMALSSSCFVRGDTFSYVFQDSVLCDIVWTCCCDLDEVIISKNLEARRVARVTTRPAASFLSDWKCIFQRENVFSRCLPMFAKFWMTLSRLYRSRLLRVKHSFCSVFLALQDLRNFPIELQLLHRSRFFKKTIDFEIS